MLELIEDVTVGCRTFIRWFNATMRSFGHTAVVLHIDMQSPSENGEVLKSTWGVLAVCLTVKVLVDVPHMEKQALGQRAILADCVLKLQAGLLRHIRSPCVATHTSAGSSPHKQVRIVEIGL